MKTKIIDKKILCCILSLILVLMCVCSSLDVYAMGNVSKPSISGLKLVDMCLTRSGKVVNEDIRESVKDQVRNVLNDTATSYWQWLKDNGKSNTTENFREYLNSDAYASLPIRFVKFPLELGSFINWLINGETILDELGTDIEDVLTETDTSGNLSVPSETVYMINECFNNVRGEFENGWHYIDVLPVSKLDSSWFGDRGSYENAKSYIESGEYPTYVIENKSLANITFEFVDNRVCLFPVIEYPDGDLKYRLTFYDENWQICNRVVTGNYQMNQFGLKDSQTFEEMYREIDGSDHWNDKGFITEPNWNMGYWAIMFVYGKEATQIKVYDSLEAVKQYSLGNSPYYLSNRQYSDSVDNSFNVSGEYLQNNGGNFSYEQIREQINNSNATTDNSVNNIVNDYSQTIINNYYGNGGSGSNDNESDNDSENGILNIIGAIGDVINFILNVIAEVISLITNFLTTVFELLKGLGSVFGSFSGLLGELFGFIPSELVDLLSTALSATVIIALWKKFSK